MEEEYVLVGREGRPVAVAAAVVAAAERFAREDDGAGTPGGELETELKQQMLETGTHPCERLDELGAEIRGGRERARRAARELDADVVATGTFPTHAPSSLTPVERYRRIGQEFGLTARENLTCGCHVHVGVDDEAEGVAVLDRIGPWLPVVLALSTNSPFWQGQDSGYQSYRSQVWSRWPTAGPTAPWGSPDAYHATIDALVASGTILDPGMVYFDARLSARYPTVEVRVADVCLRAEDATLVAGLTRALVDTAAAQARAGVPPPDVRVEQVRAATWRAGRSGLTGDLVSPLTWRPAGAWEVVGQLLEHTSTALEANGDLTAVREGLVALRRRGSGARAQLELMRRHEDLAAVVRGAVRATHGDDEPVRGSTSSS